MRLRIISLILSLSGALSSFILFAENPDNAIVYNKEDGARLTGTWLLPDSVSPKAAIVLATGSGQQDRDETLFNHKPFRAIANRLADEGYAVLRLDDRGVGGSTGDVVNATTTNFSRDIACALSWMDSVAPNIPKGVLGHSEGGLIAINLASDPLCDFIITLAAPGMPGDSITLTQARALTTAMSGKYEAEPVQKELLSIAKSDLPAEEARKLILEKMMTLMGENANNPIVKNQLEMQANMVLYPWTREFLRTDPSEKIRKVNKPWLALNGDKDFQVLPINLEIIHNLNPSATCILLPDHNHCFLECKTGYPQEYMTLPGDISTPTLDAIVSWVNRVIGADGVRGGI